MFDIRILVAIATIDLKESRLVQNKAKISRIDDFHFFRIRSSTPEQLGCHHRQGEGERQLLHRQREVGGRGREYQEQPREQLLLVEVIEVKVDLARLGDVPARNESGRVRRDHELDAVRY